MKIQLVHDTHRVKTETKNIQNNIKRIQKWSPKCADHLMFVLEKVKNLLRFDDTHQVKTETQKSSEQHQRIQKWSPKCAGHLMFFSSKSQTCMRAVNRQPCSPHGMTRRAFPHRRAHVPALNTWKQTSSVSKLESVFMKSPCVREISTFSWNEDLGRAVNRQPCLPRGMTRRAFPHPRAHATGLNTWKQTSTTSKLEFFFYKSWFFFVKSRFFMK